MPDHPSDIQAGMSTEGKQKPWFPKSYAIETPFSVREEERREGGEGRKKRGGRKEKRKKGKKWA